VSYRPDHPPTPTITRENPAFTAWVERRAVDLCTDVVCTDDGADHAQGIPCFEHLRMARAEGLAYWRKAGVL
jgi:hypothetical protein